MGNERIEKEMRALESKLQYSFNDISLLAKAMCSIKIEILGQGKNASEYENEGLATVGDAILKFVLTDILSKKGTETKGEITKNRIALENNLVLHRLMEKEGLIDYAYNEWHFHKDSNIPEHEKVVDKKHDSYMEAIIGAIYYDSNYDVTRSWIWEWLLPLLEKYKIKSCD